MMDGPDTLVPLREPVRYPGIILRNLCRGILRKLRRGVLNGLCGPAICLRILLGRPSLELPKQGFMWRPTWFRLILSGFRVMLTDGFGGGNFVVGRRVLFDRRRNLSISGRLNCWCRC